MIKSFKLYLMKESKVSDYIDNLLDKISKNGYESLTQKEKDILKKYQEKQDISRDIIEVNQVKKGPGKPKNHRGDYVRDELEKRLGLNPGQLYGTEIIQVGDEGFNMSVGLGNPDSKDLNRKFSENFEKGDVVRVIDKIQKKLSKEAYEYLMSKNAFEVLGFNKNGFIDVGFKLNGKVHYFNPLRFSKKIIGKAAKELDPYEEENWEEKSETPVNYGGGGGRDRVAPRRANDPNIRLVVGNTPYEDWGLEQNEATPITIAVLNQDGSMFDDHFVEVYHPELMNIGLFDEVEGQLSYDGHLTKEELVNQLQQLGFAAEVHNDLANLFN